MARLISLHVHPLKSGAPRDLDAAELTRFGLAGDRRWMIVDERGMVTARTEPRLLGVTVRTTALDGLADRTVELSAPGRTPLLVTEPNGPTAPVRVHRGEALGTDAGSVAADWFTALLGYPARLLWCPDPAARRLDPDFAGPDDSTAFADGYPILLTSTSSLRQVQDWVDEVAVEAGEEPGGRAITMRRFRPNLVIDEPVPFAEDGWTRVRIGTATFRVVKRCSRCVLTTVDPDTLTRGKEPLRTLGRFRRIDHGVLFGQNLIPDGDGRLHVGDDVEVLGTTDRR